MKLSKLFLFMGLSLTLGLASNGVNNFKPLDITPRGGVVLNTISEIKSLEDGSSVTFKAGCVSSFDNTTTYVADAEGNGIAIFGNDLTSFGFFDWGCFTINGVISTVNGIKVVEPNSVVKETDYSKWITPVAKSIANISNLTDNNIGDYVSIGGLDYIMSETRNGYTNFNFIASDGNEIAVRGKEGSDNTNAYAKIIESDNIGAGDIKLTGNITKSGSKYYFDLTAQTGFEKYLLSADASDLADMIISDIACDTKGTTPPDVNKWNELASLVEFLTEEDVKYFKKADAKDPFIGEAIEKYDYIISKYGSDVYQNFLNRTITSEGQNSPVLIDNTNMIITIVSISIVAISMIALLVIYKRKKVSE